MDYFPKSTKHDFTLKQLASSDEKSITEWHKLLQSELGYAQTLLDLKKKHHESPLGKSIVIAALNENGDLMAVNSFFRMPSALKTGRQIWQPGDTVTAPAARGKGLFAQITEKLLHTIPHEDLVIGFPNSNSLKPYQKLGWPVLMETNTVRGFGWRPYNRMDIEALCSRFGTSDARLIAYIRHRFSRAEYSFSAHSEYFFIHRSQLCGVFSRHGAETSKAPIPLGYRVVLTDSHDRVMMPRYSRPSGHVIGRPGQTREQTLDVLNQISPLAFLDTL